MKMGTCGGGQTFFVSTHLEIRRLVSGMVLIDILLEWIALLVVEG